MPHFNDTHLHITIMPLAFYKDLENTVQHPGTGSKGNHYQSLHGGYRPLGGAYKKHAHTHQPFSKLLKRQTLKH